MKKKILLLLFLINTPVGLVKADAINDFKIYDINAKYDSSHSANLNAISEEYRHLNLSDSEKISLGRMEASYNSSYNAFININHNTGFIDWNNTVFKIDNTYLYSFYTYHYDKLLKNYAVMNVILKENNEKQFDKNMKVIREDVKRMNKWNDNELTPQEIFLKSIAIIKEKIISDISSGRSNSDISQLINENYLSNKDNFSDYIYSQAKGYEKQYNNLNKSYKEGSQKRYQYLIDLNRMNFD